MRAGENTHGAGRRRSPDLSLGVEWAILERLCLGVGDAEDEAGFDALLESPRLDWGELLIQALRHQMVPMLALHALAGRTAAAVPFYVADHLASALALNRRRLGLYRREAARICEALVARGVPFVATKGITFESTLYGGRGARMLKDIDFMIPPERRDEVKGILARLGYTPGVYDWGSDRIEPHPRRDLMRYLLNPDHLPRVARRLDDPCVRYVYADVANSLTWANSPYAVPVAAALASARRQSIPETPSVELPCFAPDYQFLFTVLHLFREAWLDNWMDYGIDVSLMKFGDVIRLFEAHRAELCRPEFVGLLEAHRVVEPVLWVLEHLDRTFGTATVAALGLAGHIEEDWLAAAHPARGRERRWTGDMRQRLHHQRRGELFVERETAPD